MTKTTNHSAHSDAGVAESAARMSAIRRDFCLYRLLSPGPRAAIDEEKRRFFEARERGEVYNPAFAYPPIDASRLDAERRWLGSLSFAATPLEVLLAEERDTLQLHLDLLAARDGGNAAEFTRRTLLAFPAPTETDITSAREFIASVPERGPAASYTADELAAMAQRRLDELGLELWKIEVDSHLLSVLKVETANRLIQIKGEVTFDDLDVISLVHHEIDGHAVRAENGFALGYDFLGTGVGDEVELDEGVAVYLEVANGGMIGRRALEVAARVVAAEAALRGDFASTYDVVEELAPSIGRDLLFQMVARVKRGLSATSEPGGWPKDAQYFIGYRKVSDLMASAPTTAARDAVWQRLMRARVSWRGVDTAAALADSLGAPQLHAPTPPEPATEN